MFFSASEVTVRSSDLKPCQEDKEVCVVDPRDCDPRPSSVIQSTHTLAHIISVQKDTDIYQTHINQMFSCREPQHVLLLPDSSDICDV